MNPVVYVNPDTAVDICRGVPLPQNYEHVCTFSSSSATYSAFSNYIKYHVPNCTPVKVPNAVRVPYGFNNLSDCNYLIFSNYSAGTNRIYAFITEIRYVNENMCEIYYTVDIWTTNYYNMSFGRCYVEREHVIDDTYGLHTIPENLETGEYISIARNTLDYDMDYTCILFTPSSDYAVAGQVINDIFTGLNIRTVTNKNDLVRVIEDITKEAQYPERIVAMFHYPSLMGDLSEGTSIGERKISITKPLTLDGYVPKNNKCFTKEFTYLLLDDHNGGTNTYAWELFDNDLGVGDARFRMVGTFITMPVLNTYPQGYKGINECYVEGVTTSNFPNIAWSSSAFAQWWAQNKNALASQAVGIGLTGLAAAFTGNVPLAVAGTAVSALNLAQQSAFAVGKASQQPAQVHGQTQLDSLNIADNRTKIDFYKMTVKKEVAEQIDGFFEAFGYRVNTLKVPNITGRPYWNFVKTSNAVINGTLFMDSTGDVESILNRGVTIWHNLNNIGNYSLNNH